MKYNGINFTSHYQWNWWIIIKLRIGHFGISLRSYRKLNSIQLWNPTCANNDVPLTVTNLALILFRTSLKFRRRNVSEEVPLVKLPCFHGAERSRATLRIELTHLTMQALRVREEYDSIPSSSLLDSSGIMSLNVTTLRASVSDVSSGEFPSWMELELFAKLIM